jgi:hypothetical protein
MIFRQKQKISAKTDPVRFSKKVIVAVLILVVVFTVVMIVIFVIEGSIPDTLVTSVFAFAGGEAGALSLIKYSETKYTDHATKDSTDSDSGDAAG